MSKSRQEKIEYLQKIIPTADDKLKDILVDWTDADVTCLDEIVQRIENINSNKLQVLQNNRAPADDEEKKQKYAEEDSQYLTTLKDQDKPIYSLLLTYDLRDGLHNLGNALITLKKADYDVDADMITIFEKNPPDLAGMIAQIAIAKAAKKTPEKINPEYFICPTVENEKDEKVKTNKYDTRSKPYIDYYSNVKNIYHEIMNENNMAAFEEKQKNTMSINEEPPKEKPTTLQANSSRFYQVAVSSASAVMTTWNYFYKKS